MNKPAFIRLVCFSSIVICITYLSIMLNYFIHCEDDWVICKKDNLTTWTMINVGVLCFLLFKILIIKMTLKLQNEYLNIDVDILKKMKIVGILCCVIIIIITLLFGLHVIDMKDKSLKMILFMITIYPFFLIYLTTLLFNAVKNHPPDYPDYNAI